MPTQRPFFANFLAAFRAHTSPAFNAKSSATSPGVAGPNTGVSPNTHVTTTNNSSSHPSTTASNPRSISTKTASAFQSQQTQTPSSSPDATTSTSVGATSTSLSRSPNTTTAHYVNMSISPPGSASPLSRGRQRRGSDSSSSSGGFKDILGPEKWYIGGRTASGEEKFYRLGMVTAPGGGIGGSGRRVPSVDRLSL